MDTHDSLALGNGFQTTYADYERALRDRLCREEWSAVRRALDERHPDTSAILSRFQSIFPDSEFEPEIRAEQSREAALASTARDRHCAAGYRDYLKETRLFSVPARDMIEKERRDFGKCKRGVPKTREAACRAFLSNWPKSEHVEEVRERLSQAQDERLRADALRDWDAANRKNTVKAFEDFVARWPLSEFADQATARRDGLIAAATQAEEDARVRARQRDDAAREERQRQEAADRARRQREAAEKQTRDRAAQRARAETAFAEAKRAGTVAAVRKFLADHPASAFEAEARALLETLQSEAERQNRLQRMKRLARDRAEAVEANSAEGYRKFLETWGKDPEGDWARNRLAVLDASDALDALLRKGADVSRGEVNGPTLVAVMRMADRFEADDAERRWYRDMRDRMEARLKSALFPGRFLPALTRWLLAKEVPKQKPGYSGVRRAKATPTPALQPRAYIAAGLLVAGLVALLVANGLFWGIVFFAANVVQLLVIVLLLELASGLVDHLRVRPSTSRGLYRELIEYRRYKREGGR